MKTWKNQQELKEAAIAAAIWHRDQHMLARGTYWQGNRGCAIGCHAHHIRPDVVGGGQHAIVADGYGWPLWLCHLADCFFENTSYAYSQKWPEALCRAIPVGVDIAPVLHLFLVAVLEEALPHATEEVAAIIRRVQSLHTAAAAGQAVSQEAAAAEAAAAEAAAEAAADPEAAAAAAAPPPPAPAPSPRGS